MFTDYLTKKCQFLNNYTFLFIHKKYTCPFEKLNTNFQLFQGNGCIWPFDSMPQKRRNCGRAKMNAGRKQTVNCLNCGKMVPRDKAIKRFMTKNMVDASSAKDVLDQEIFKDYELPKSYQKCFYCVSCACHRRIVRVRSRTTRRIRVPLFLKLQRERLEQRQNQNQNQHKNE